MWFGVTPLQAQDQNQDRRPPGNFDPQQMRQRMLDHMREQLEVQDDAEWQVVSARITKVMEARRALGGGGGFGGPPPFILKSRRNADGQEQAPLGGNGDSNGGPPGPGGPDNGVVILSGPPDGPGGAGGPRGFGRPADPDLEALRKAIDSKASASELKAKLATYRDARKKKEADLEKAQDDLRQILSTRQEAVAVTLGLLK